MGLFLIFNRLFRGHDCVIIGAPGSTKYYFLRGEYQMNTCLSELYLKLSHFDARIIRLALLVVAAAVSGGVVLGLPISGDVTG